MLKFTSKTLYQYLAFATLILSVLACGGASTASPVAPVESTSVPAETATQETSSEPFGSSPQNPVPRGETIVSADWEFRVVEVVRGEDVMVKLQEGSPFNKEHSNPAMEYVLILVHAKYIGPDTSATHRIDRTFISGSIGSANVMYDAVSMHDVTSLSPFLQGELLPGQEVEGWAVIQVAKGETGIMLVIWPRDNGFATGEETMRYFSLE